jgi:hypothetical protein
MQSSRPASALVCATGLSLRRRLCMRRPASWCAALGGPLRPSRHPASARSSLSGEVAQGPRRLLRGVHQAVGAMPASTCLAAAAAFRRPGVPAPIARAHTTTPPTFPTPLPPSKYPHRAPATWPTASCTLTSSKRSARSMARRCSTSSTHGCASLGGPTSGSGRTSCTSTVRGQERGWAGQEGNSAPWAW